MGKKLSMILAFLILLFPSAVVSEAAFDRTAYEAEREELVGSRYTDAEMSEEEKAVDALLKSFRAEADQFYTKGTGYGLITAGNPLAAESDLYAFCLALPKGGDLHTHNFSLISIHTLLDVLTDYPGIYICPDEGDTYAYLYAPGVEKPESAVPLKQALEDGSVTREELCKAFSLEAGLTPRQEWDRFQPFFEKTDGLKGDPVLLEQLFTAGFQSRAENGSILVELRLRFGNSDEENIPLLNAVKNAYFNVKRNFPAFTVRIIGSAGKSEETPVDESEDCLRSAIRLSREIPDDFDPEHVRPFIIGLDLVNEEDSSRPLTDYAGFFLSDEVKNSGLQLMLHCGESLRFDNESVVDAFLFGSRRMGHAFNLFRYPKIMNQLAEEQIAVEVCPISNCLLGYVHDLRLHPGQYYFRNGVPVVLCSDDAVFMEDAPLTEDYFAAILSWNLSLAEVKALSENAILFSCLSPEEISELHAFWEEQWDAFITEWSQIKEPENAA